MHAKSLLLLLVCLIVRVLANKDEPKLGLVNEPNADKAKKNTPTRYSALLQFPNIENAWKEILDEKPKRLAELARNGFWQMSNMWVDDKEPWKTRPSVMSALVVGNEIYLSSSLKGVQNFLYSVDSTNP
jgi:hypothetical protein